MTAPELALVGQHVCEALAASHAVGVIHRDIKPHNLLIGAFGQVKVCDFGIASLAVKRASIDNAATVIRPRVERHEPNRPSDGHQQQKLDIITRNARRYTPVGWASDPLGSHELRYWNGARWTEHVSDLGQATTDIEGSRILRKLMFGPP